MRGLPFFKAKNKPQFAGFNFGDSGGGGAYTLPPATSETLGGVKIGTGINVLSDGTISSSGGILNSYTLNDLVSSKTLHKIETIPVVAGKTYIITCDMSFVYNETTKLLLSYSTGNSNNSYETIIEGASHVALAFTPTITGNICLWGLQNVTVSGAHYENCKISILTL